jgi:hypothetical protein
MKFEQNCLEIGAMFDGLEEKGSIIYCFDAQKITAIVNCSGRAFHNSIRASPNFGNSRKLSFASKLFNFNKNLFNFNAKLSFALLAFLKSAFLFTKSEWTNNWLHHARE